MLSSARRCGTFAAAARTPVASLLLARRPLVCCGVARPRPAARPAAAPCKAHQQPSHHHQPAKLLAGLAAAAAGVFAPLLPAWSFDTDFLLASEDMSGLDPALAESPQLLDTLLVILVTYFTVATLWLWLSSFMDEDADAGSTGGSSPSDPSQSEMPPGYGQFLDAHVRSVVTPDARAVTALRELSQAQPLEGEDLERLKGRLAAGAAEALELQLRECERLVRSKLLARSLGYRPTRPASSSSSSGALPAHLARDEIGALMTAAVLTAPGGLSSWQHRAAVEALIDTQLDDLLPPGGGRYQEDLITRQTMRRLVAHLVLEESLLLLEGTQQGARTLEAAGKARKPGAAANWWALW